LLDLVPAKNQIIQQAATAMLAQAIHYVFADSLFSLGFRNGFRERHDGARL
jgi:hypothetical protein